MVFLAFRRYYSRRRPYRVECTGSLLTSEVKRRRARLVLGWGTAREDLGWGAVGFHCQTTCVYLQYAYVYVYSLFPTVCHMHAPGISKQCAYDMVTSFTPNVFESTIDLLQIKVSLTRPAT